MKKQLLTRILINFGLMALLLAGLSTVGLAQGGTRPPYSTPTPPPSGDGGTGGASSDSAAASVSGNCAALYGEAINWGFGSQGGVGVRLVNGSWQANQMSSDDGRYHFGNLGIGVGKLSVNADNLSLTPMINNAAVRLSCDFYTLANIGLYSGNERPETPAQIHFSSAPESVAPGSTTVLMLKINNTLPTPISQVIVTDLFPEGVTVETVNASAGEAEVLNDNMLTVVIGSIPSGAEESISITLHIADNLSSDTELRNTATLFYAESAADQDHLILMVKEAEVAAPVMQETISTSAPLSAASFITYTIQEGDILYELAPEYGVSAESIMAANSITNPRALQIGQQIIIPAGEDASLQLADAAAPTEVSVPTTLPVTGVGVSLTFFGLAFIVIVLVGQGVRSINKRR